MNAPGRPAPPSAVRHRPAGVRLGVTCRPARRRPRRHLRGVLPEPAARGRAAQQSTVPHVARNRSRRARAGGAILFTMLVFLAVLALLGLGTLQDAALAERLARQQADRALALRAAEAALRDAERDLEGRRADGTPCPAGASGCRPVGERPIAGRHGAGLAPFTPECGMPGSRGQCLRREDDYYPVPVWREPALLARAARLGEYTGAPAPTGLAGPPRYFVEGFRRAPGYVFRISALAEGALPGTRVMLQSFYLMGE